VIGAGLAVTYSRAAVVGLLLASVVLTLGRERAKTAGLVAAVATGFVFGVLVFGNGWTARAETSANSSHFDSGRRELAEQAFDFIADHPATGVGPGRYTIALFDSPNPPEVPLPVHNVVLLEAAESGVAAGALCLAILLGLGVRAWRAGSVAFAAWLMLMPFLNLDPYPMAFPGGFALTALWIGFLTVRSPDRSQRRAAGGPGPKPTPQAAERPFSASRSKPFATKGA
jgi:O-antigen ligase